MYWIYVLILNAFQAYYGMYLTKVIQWNWNANDIPFYFTFK